MLRSTHVHQLLQRDGAHDLASMAYVSDKGGCAAMDPALEPACASAAELQWRQCMLLVHKQLEQPAPRWQLRLDTIRSNSCSG